MLLVSGQRFLEVPARKEQLLRACFAPNPSPNIWCWSTSPLLLLPGTSLQEMHESKKLQLRLDLLFWLTALLLGHNPSQHGLSKQVLLDFVSWSQYFPTRAFGAVVVGIYFMDISSPSMLCESSDCGLVFLISWTPPFPSCSVGERIFGFHSWTSPPPNMLCQSNGCWLDFMDTSSPSMLSERWEVAFL